MKATSSLNFKQECNVKSILIEVIWDRNTDCIIDVRICDVNQASYLTRKSASIVKSAENEKKEVLGALPREEKALYSFCCIL